MINALRNLVVVVCGIVRTQIVGIMVAIATVSYVLGHITVSEATLLVVLALGLLLLDVHSEVGE